MHSELIHSFKQIVSLEIPEEQLIQKLFKPMSLKKDVFFLREGQLNNYIGFIRKEIIRYFVFKNEEESKVEFISEGEL